MIKYIKDNCLSNKYKDRSIAHVCNNKGGFGKGFALSLASKYPIVRNKYKEWYGFSLLYGGNKFKLGCIQEITINDNLIVINMLCQDGYKSNQNKVPLDYMALEMCLTQIRDRMIKLNLPLHMPKIGSGYAGGDWSKIESIIKEVFKDDPELEIVIFELE